MSQKKKDSILKNYALRIALNTASHPVEYAKILIQVRIPLNKHFTLKYDLKITFYTSYINIS